jgi:transcriptional regulator with XRE-family HTH domain
VPRERDMAIELRVRSRLYRTEDGLLMEQFEKTVHSDFRSYANWAENEAQPLREAIDAACAELGRTVSAVHLRSPPRAGISERPGG